MSAPSEKIEPREAAIWSGSGSSCKTLPTGQKEPDKHDGGGEQNLDQGGARHEGGGEHDG